MLELNKIYCGDCLELMKDIPDKSIDLVLTDPPYGIDYDPTKYKKWNGDPNNYTKIINDDKDFNPIPLLRFQDVIIWGANNFSELLPRGGWLCWDKRLDENLDKMFGSPFELGWVKNKRYCKMKRLQHGGVVNADSIVGNNEKRLHPTQKPIALMKWCIELFPNADLILDPFCGSGTTCVAAKLLGRNYIGIDISPEYCKITEARLRNTEENLFKNPPAK